MVLKNKTIRVFDTENIRRGQLITFSQMHRGDEDSNGEDTVEEGPLVNGIIIEVTEDNLTVRLTKGAVSLAIGDVYEEVKGSSPSAGNVIIHGIVGSVMS